MKILSLLTASKEERENNKANRVAKALKRNQEALIDKLEARKDEAQDTIDNLLNVSINKIKVDNFNETYHKAKLELVLVEKELEIANEVMKDLYAEA